MGTMTPAASSPSRQWHVIDADGQVLGRVASQSGASVAGQAQAELDAVPRSGDHVVVVNAAKVQLTGRKEDQKIYRQHSGYEGGLREERARIVRQKQPIRLVEEAVHGHAAEDEARARRCIAN